MCPKGGGGGEVTPKKKYFGFSTKKSKLCYKNRSFMKKMLFHYVLQKKKNKNWEFDEKNRIQFFSKMLKKIVFWTVVAILKVNFWYFLQF